MKTLIYGAGASIPFFEPPLTTKYLTNCVLCKLKWQNIIAKYAKHNTFTVPTYQEVIKIIEIIKGINPDYNFEQIAEIIDKIASWSFDKIPQNNMLNALIKTLINCDVFVQNKNLENWKHVPFLFRMIIAEAILDLQKNHKSIEYKKLIDSQHDFLESYTEKDKASIVSFNYDDILLDSIDNLGFEQGFTKGNIRGRRLSVSLIYNSEKAIYFPHGHLRFNFLDDENVEYYSDSSNAHKARWQNSISIYSPLVLTKGKFAYNFNTFITTGQTKDDSLNLLPYSFYYQKLAVDIFKSSEIILVGYSFGDEHLNRLLVSFLAVNSKNKVLIVDRYLDNVLLTEEYKNQDNIIYKISITFKVFWGLVLTADVKKTNRPKEVEHINKHGYDFLFSQILFYKKGYDEFLTEYDSVIQFFRSKD